MRSVTKEVNDKTRQRKNGKKKKWDQETRDGQKGDEGKKGKKEKTEREEKEMKAKWRYEKQGIGEQGEKNWERGERNERWKFFQSGQKGDHENSSYEEGLTRWKKDARITIVKNTRRFFCLNNEVNKMEDSPERNKNREWKEEERKNEETEKIRKFTRNKVQNKGEIFF